MGKDEADEAYQVLVNYARTRVGSPVSRSSVLRRLSAFPSSAVSEALTRSIRSAMVPSVAMSGLGELRREHLVEITRDVSRLMSQAEFVTPLALRLGDALKTNGPYQQTQLSEWASAESSSGGERREELLDLVGQQLAADVAKQTSSEETSEKDVRPLALSIAVIYISLLLAWWLAEQNRLGQTPRQVNTFSLMQEAVFAAETAKYVYNLVLVLWTKATD